MHHFLLICITAMWVCACQSPEDDSIRFGLSSAPQNLDPRFATDATSSRINRLLYRQLVKFDANYQPQPDLATWALLSSDHYRFHLKTTGRRFAHGSYLTSEDVAATYQFILDERNGSPHRSSLDKRIRKMVIVDDNTIDFYVKQVDPMFPAYLTVGIMPKDLMKKTHPFSQDPVGSGAYRLLKWKAAGRLVLERVADGQKVVFIQSKDPSVRTLKLIRGEIDLIQNELPKELVGYLSKQPGIQVSKAKGSNFAYIGFNLDDPLTGQLAIRQAIAHAVDRKAIIQYLLNGAARTANAFFPPDHWAANPELNDYQYDPDKAKALLANAGFTAQKPLKLTYKTSTNPLRVRIATVIQNQLAAVGIQVDVRTYDWGTFYADIKKGNFQMYSLSWVGIKTPDIFDYVFTSTNTPQNHGANRGRYNNPKVDRLIADAAKGKTLRQQAQIYREIQAILWQDLPYVPLWYEDHFYAARESIRQYHIPMDGNYDGLLEVMKRTTY